MQQRYRMRSQSTAMRKAVERMSKRWWIDWCAMPGRFLSLRSPAIWFKDASPVATELSKDWRNAAAVNLRDLRMINRVWLAMKSRLGRLGRN